MLLCLDVGNTHILGGVFQKEKLITRFRYATHLVGTADQFGIFLLNILNTNGIQPNEIKATAVCSVVPGCDYTLRHAISLYIKSTYFVLQAGAKTGLNIRYKNPNEVGADRIANSVGAMSLYPDQNIIIIDMGTATTMDVVTSNRDYLGGAIFPGMRLGMESLKLNTAKLVEVDIEVPHSSVGKTTRESIQAGLFFGQLGALKELLSTAKREYFPNDSVQIIATGGFAQLYRDYHLFDIVLPDLVLVGLHKAYTLSTSLRQKN